MDHWKKKSMRCWALMLSLALLGCNGKKGGDEDGDADADGDAVTDDGGVDGIDVTGDDVVAPDLDVVEDGEIPGPDALCFEHLRLDGPNGGGQQTASLVLDVDGDGVNDFIVTERTQAPSVVWYRRTDEGWDLYTVDDTTLRIEAGGDWHDIDGDGDNDIVFGGDSGSNQVWWWENPAPDFDPDTPWTRRLIKNSGSNKHHDEIFGDFDGDGEAELVFWNQQASTLFLADIPSDPRGTEPWPLTEIYTWSGGDEHEGLSRADMDGDGLEDIVGGGRWFKRNGAADYTANVIDAGQTFTRSAAGQVAAGGNAEAVFVIGDGTGPLTWYEGSGETWSGHDPLDFDVDHGHSLQLVDFNGDGNLDIFVAEMRLDGGNPDAGMWLLFGDGGGNFTVELVASGYGNHESRVADLDGDGDMDILGKPYNWEAPRVDVWLNCTGEGYSLDRWQRHVIDADRPWRAVFIDAADLDGDGLPDIATGGWWYANPGSPDGAWTRNEFGSSLNNMAVLHDFDGDGDADVLGTTGQGSDASSDFRWARSDGAGSFSVLDNIESGDGDFLQGVCAAEFASGGPLEIALSWHQADRGVQMLTVPSDPAAGTWTWRQIIPESQDEALSCGDIGGDGDVDLLMGTLWLENDGGTWSLHTLSDAAGSPDRNRLADLNGDGRLDAVVGYEAISVEGKLAWYEQPATPTDLWPEHVISESVVGPMSVDAEDMDGDGDVDVVMGEHNLDSPDTARLLVFENLDGTGGGWAEHLVYRGDEHHDGAVAADMDGDGDLDIISIGWGHTNVVLYENLAR